MSALFGDTVTVYSHTVVNRADVWKRTVVRGVQWRRKFISAFSTNGKIVFQSETSITIPHEAMPAGLLFNRGDIVVLGECSQSPGTAGVEDILINSFSGATVQVVLDNTRRPQLRHWKVKCI